jgi:uncharacterized membrane protein
MILLLKSRKFWAAVIPSVIIIASKFGVKLSAEELTAITAPFVMLIGAIAAEDAAEKRAKK